MGNPVSLKIIYVRFHNRCGLRLTLPILLFKRYRSFDEDDPQTTPPSLLLVYSHLDIVRVPQNAAPYSSKRAHPLDSRCPPSFLWCSYSSPSANHETPRRRRKE